MGKIEGRGRRGVTEDEMAAWHHQLNGHEFENTPRDSEGQGNLVCCEVKSEVSQSCPTLCNPMNCSLPGSSVHGIFQERILEWVSMLQEGCKELDMTQQLNNISSVTQKKKPVYLNRGMGFPGGSVVKTLPASSGDTGSIPDLKIPPGEGNGNHSSFLPGKLHGQRSLAGCSPWGCRHNLQSEQQHVE